ncbi:sugar 3,4-ketoisomerase [Anaerosacchariphilus polymeriproducens]|uniref:WxcM-like domain-containing protein n=1 Tax=Anaerosacchariphilus polymeriproducens TaxID=1812858 RepID=A0A371ARC0_9FIRM|nr:FdtA/QdtA family cupin domain-containing protein [Anaerosacchariphilus polymeriproducens]RDU22119.1 WxcM-like domain-containing protein [Anaerosacchariphilus polymeriproducens]
MYNTGMLKFRCIKDQYGHLTPIEATNDIPFEVKRIYYITNVESNVTRGFHSHKKLHQVLICVNGSVKIRLKIPNDQSTVELNDKSEGLYIGPMVWREMYDFSEGAVLLVLASEHYDENDYIRNYDFYVNEAKKTFDDESDI